MANCFPFFRHFKFPFPKLRKSFLFGWKEKSPSHQDLLFFFLSGKRVVNMFAWETFGVFEHFVHYILTCSILTTVCCLSLTSVRWANSVLMNEYSESRLIYDLYVRWLKRKYTDFNIRRKVFPFLLESKSFFPTHFFPLGTL